MDNELSLQKLILDLINNLHSFIVIIQILLIAVCILFLAGFLLERKKNQQARQRFIRKSKRLERSNYIATAMLKNVHAFILLINKDFVVLKTNYYQRTGTHKSHKEKRVGDLLQCYNANSAEGGCGTHAYCSSCPIRHAICEAFEMKKSFTDLEATLKVAVSRSEFIECDVIISGTYLILDDTEKMVLTVHDVTQQKKAEKELVLAKEKAEQADISKSAFLANMSHEIRTPLNAITGFAEIMASANTEEEKVQYQDIIKRNADLLLQLVNDILDISKIEAGTLEFIYTEVDMNTLLSDLKQLFAMRMSESGGNVKIEVDPSLSSCLIRTDRNRIAQVLSNFVTNAIKFTKEGSICIGYETNDTEIYFYVTDTGTGIPTNQLPNVFERFVKLNKEKQGTGLGLSICKTIVNRLEGEIGVKSVEGEGSTFWFTIPYHSCGHPRIID